MSRVAHALERALGVWSSSSNGDIEDFLCHAATELLHIGTPRVEGLAIVTRGTESESVVAKPRDVIVLPDETLRGFLADAIDGGGGCKVRDHALDTVRFIDAHFRTSVTAVGSVPAALGVGSDLAVWGGLVGGVTPKLISEVRGLADELSRWLDSARVTLLSVLELRRRNRECHLRLREMTSVAHDVRAPLASLCYLLSDVEQSHPGIIEETGKIQAEISYINTLMERFSPASRAPHRSEDAVCDLVATLRRVGSRLMCEAVKAGVAFVWDVPYEETCVKIDPLVLERALTNVVANSIKHSGAPEVEIKVVKHEHALVTRIIDRGVGIPHTMIERVNLAAADADLALDSIRHAAGWGVGLLSTKNSIERCGGQVRVRSHAGETCVELELVRASKSRVFGERAGVVTSPRPPYGEARVILVDDDVEHTASLARVLSRAGVTTQSFDSVDAALAYIMEAPGAKIVCDARMPDGGAERVLCTLRLSGGARSVAVMSGDADDEVLYRFAALGASEFFAKPIDAERLAGWVGSPGMEVAEAAPVDESPTVIAGLSHR